MLSELENHGNGLRVQSLLRRFPFWEESALRFLFFEWMYENDLCAVKELASLLEVRKPLALRLEDGKC